MVFWRRVFNPIAVLPIRLPHHLPTVRLLIFASPLTSSLAHGVRVPIPTFVPIYDIPRATFCHWELQLGPLDVDHVARPFASEVRTFPAHWFPSTIFTCHTTSSLAHGVEVPIPTFAQFQRMTVSDCIPNVFAQMRVTLLRLTLVTSAPPPIAVLLLPMVLEMRVFIPFAVLLYPVVL